MKRFLTGNHAVAEAVRLCRPQMVAAYPITPQTPIYEKLSDWDAEGCLGGTMMRTESEHSAMAACLSASLTGIRTFTATSSQGLALMHEMLHFASGLRTAVVMAVVNRQLGIATYSPPLDERGNSRRGIEVCSGLAARLGLHVFDCLNAGSSYLKVVL